MTILNKISETRLSNQQIAGSKFNKASDLVSWMGAIQAQDYNMAKWAIGRRLPGSTDKLIEEAFNNGEIVRTHILRPTWHFVSPNDISWMLELTGEQIKATMRSSDRYLGITKSIFEKSNMAIEKGLTKNKDLTRKGLFEVLMKANIKFTDSRAYRHIILHAELDGVICSGVLKGKEQTYTLLSRLVKKTKRYKKDEALYELAKRYFISHGPATLYDFSWWSGLRINDSQRAIDLVNKEMFSEKKGSKTYWFSQSATPRIEQNSIHLLPAYDEFIISY
ncbi:MAG: winged helix DNA-binding domain-containing protein, partial [bacterium]